jgi:hypothetical protein
VRGSQKVWLRGPSRKSPSSGITPSEYNDPHKAQASAFFAAVENQESACSPTVSTSSLLYQPQHLLLDPTHSIDHLSCDRFERAVTLLTSTLSGTTTQTLPQCSCRPTSLANQVLVN